ncbi:uncharacterized protein JCM6883_003895 [Sporobolomyces salmoneus]|uniref:uncharacterized protein n=1 Tax=Sporobolomyces salmoneus TaxID=183962 RepID=UPI00317B2A5B
MWDVFQHLVDDIASLPLASVLINRSWKRIDEVLEEPWNGVNLRLVVQTMSSWSATGCASTIDTFASRLKNPRKFATLKSIYLPPPSSLSQEYKTDEILKSIENLVHAAKDRNLLVVFEEQSDKRTGECQVSEEFMRRMIQRRIAREAAEGA